jgi:hypothetical protein
MRYRQYVGTALSDGVYRHRGPISNNWYVS